MKAKTFFTALLAVLSMASATAEDIIQALPFHTTAGVMSDEETTDFYITMNNSSANIWAFQFDILLPDGMTFDEDFPLDFYIDDETDESRFPYTVKGKRIIFNHNDPLISKEKEGGWRTVVVSTDDATRIEGNSGILLKVFYNTAADMQPGIYPIYIRGTVMTITGTSDIKPAESVSYVVIGDTSPLQTEAHVDLTGLTGYVPSFVVEAINDELAQNDALVSVDLSGATELGAELVVPENAVWQTASASGLQRTLPAAQWSTVCLPFALNEAQVNALKNSGVEIEQLSSFDEAANTIDFESVDQMEAHMPYIVKCSEAQAPFAHIDHAAAASPWTPTPITKGAVSMQGTYERLTLDSDEATTYYAYDAANGTFVRIGRNATVLPYRAYVSLDKATSNSRLRVSHHGDTATRILRTAEDAITANQQCHDLSGRRITTAATRGTIIIKNGQKQLTK